jgi:hypothetical protein
LVILTGIVSNSLIKRLEIGPKDVCAKIELGFPSVLIWNKRGMFGELETAVELGISI